MTEHPTMYDAREELRLQIALWESEKLGSDQAPQRRDWVIACFKLALTQMAEPPAP